MVNSDYKTIFASVRPQRVAVLVDKSDPDWRNTCLRIIEFYSTVWGGKYNIIVPTDGKTISRDFWKVLESYDADYIYTYSKTFLDLKLARPSEYNITLERETDGWMAGSPAGTDRDESRKMIDEQLQNAPVSTLEITHELQTELKQRTAPFYFENWIVQAGGIGARSPASYPLTSLVKILPNIDHPTQVTQISSPDELLLWSSAVAGRIPGEYAGELQEIGVSVKTESYEDRLWDLFGRVVSGWNESNKETESPFSLSMTSLGLYRSLKYRYWEEPAVVVVGDSVDDFCLYYCLSRMRDRVSWLLPDWLPESTETTAPAGKSHGTHYAHALNRLLWQRNHSRTATFISASQSAPEVERVRSRLVSASGGGSLSGVIAIGEISDDFYRFPLVAYDRDNVSRDTTKYFIDGELAGLFETPKPKNFKVVDPAEHRWITELSIKDLRLPRHFSLGRWVIRDHRLGTGEARAGLNGVAYFCPNVGYFGGDIDSVLVKPSLHVPDSLDVFNRIAQQVEVSGRVSDKGLYAQETIRKFGGLGNLANSLRHERKRSLLSKFLDTTRPAEGIQDEGVFLGSDQRRYLNFSSVQKIVGEQEATAKLIDEWIGASVFYRGFIFKCGYCRNADWFSIVEITEQFECKRCGREQTYTRDHWRQPQEPSWFYKLDEILYQGIKNDMLVPLLALDCLQRKTESSFLYTTDLELYQSGSSDAFIEIDICCFPDGIFTIGEAKREDRIASGQAEDEAIRKYRDLAGRLGVRQVVFATGAAAWSEVTKQRIEENFQGCPVAVTLLTRSDLFSA